MDKKDTPAGGAVCLGPSGQRAQSCKGSSFSPGKTLWGAWRPIKTKKAEMGQTWEVRRAGGSSQ